MSQENGRDLPLHELVSGFHAETARLAPEILRDSLAYALATMGHRIAAEAVAAVERLRAELDAYQGRQVLYATDAKLDEVSTEIADAVPGTVLRATDTGRELILTRLGDWEPRPV